ncbi:MAG: hypothetical protein EXS50_01350 [Candidatus Taylorbacteria bacterium]|nr:hypothetical protein [Candidatus Taylorbacteria bacterium]
MQKINTKKYILVFLITAIIFFTAFWISQFLNDKKLSEIKIAEDKISIDILTLETQFELLQETSSCKKIDGGILSDELNSLADQLSYAEDHSEINSQEVRSLKKYYSILEIKDFLLTKKISEKCKLHSIVILYFYSNKQECRDCQKQAYVLTYLREHYPRLRVYTFDYDLDSNAVQTLVSLHEVGSKFPAIMINDKVYNGFQSIEDIQKKLPELLDTSSTTTKYKIRP